MGLAPPSLPLLSPRPAVPLIGGSGTFGSRSFKGGSVRSPGSASSLSLPEGATSLPPGLITSLHTPVHLLITSLHTPVHLLITHSCSQCVDYLCTSAPSLWLPRLPLPALTCACMYVHYISCLTDHIRFRALGTPALRCRLGCPVADYCFVFACWLLI